MKVVLLTAVVLASGVRAGKWWQLRALRASAMGEYSAAERSFDEGRILVYDCVLTSEKLMNVELLACITRGQEARVIDAHLLRARRLIVREVDYQRERGLILGCHEHAEQVDLAEARSLVEKSEVNLLKLKARPSTIP